MITSYYVTRKRDLAEESICNDGEVEDTRRKFEDCFHDLATGFYDVMENNDKTEKIEIILCRTISKISSQCFQHLAVCLSSKDMEEMKEIHLMEIKNFFTRMLDKKVNKDYMTSCGQEENHKYESSTEISNTLVYAYDDDDYDDYEYYSEITINPENHHNSQHERDDISNMERKEVTKNVEVALDKMERNYENRMQPRHKIMLIVLSLIACVWI